MHAVYLAWMSGTLARLPRAMQQPCCHCGTCNTSMSHVHTHCTFRTHTASRFRNDAKTEPQVPQMSHTPPPATWHCLLLAAFLPPHPCLSAPHPAASRPDPNGPQRLLHPRGGAASAPAAGLLHRPHLQVRAPAGRRAVVRMHHYLLLPGQVPFQSSTLVPLLGACAIEGANMHMRTHHAS